MGTTNRGHRRAAGWVMTAVACGLLALRAVLAGRGTFDRGAAGVPTRDEMRGRLVGKTDDEVIGLVGFADRIDLADPARPVWTYRRPTRDPGTGRVDPAMYVVFRHNVAVDVRF